MLSTILHMSYKNTYMTVIFWVFTPCSELCFTVLQEHTASIFSMSEFVQVAAEVMWWQTIRLFLHPVTSPPTWTNSVTLKMEAMHSSEIHTKCINVSAFCGQRSEFPNVKTGGVLMLHETWKLELLYSGDVF